VVYNHQGTMKHKRDAVAGMPLAAREAQPSGEALGRKLIHIPIIHTQADMGALSQPIKDLTVRKLGQAGWERNVNAIAEIWTRIETAIDGWSLPYQRLRLYQDGLPVCGREADIVAELAKAGSRNHRLLLRLMRRGAMLMGTESAALLVREYKLVKQVLEAGDSHKALQLEARYKARSRALLKERDRAVAQRINTTLRPGETGLVFLGMLHSLERWLAPDIHLTHPVFSPLAAKSQKI
jgi:hypothetical protein